MFAPPFRDPFNYYFHPVAIAGIDVVGAMMQERFIMEGKPGVTQRKGAPYSTWFNGGIRTTAHFHNMIGILTETIGNPTPISIPFLPATQIGDSNLYWPITPQQDWHLRQSIEYSMTANRAILDYASRYRERVLYNIYRMGKRRDSVGQRGSLDVHAARDGARPGRTGRRRAITPSEIPERPRPATADGGGAWRRWRARRRRGDSPLYAGLTAPELRDPRGFIMPSDQPDFGTATQFVNALIKTGITIQRATAPFTVAGKTYPANSYVVKTAQAFRPHVHGHVRAAGSSRRHPVPGRAADAAVRHHRLHARVPDGRAVRSHSRRVRRPFEKLTDFAKVAGRQDHAAQTPPPAITSATRPTTASSSSTGCWRRVKKSRGCRPARWAAAPSMSRPSRRRERFSRRRRASSA